LRQWCEKRTSGRTRAGLQQCIAEGEGVDGVDAKRMETLFLGLA
jgi:hypothetical protein